MHFQQLRTKQLSKITQNVFITEIVAYAYIQYLVSINILQVSMNVNGLFFCMTEFFYLMEFNGFVCNFMSECILPDTLSICKNKINYRLLV